MKLTKLIFVLVQRNIKKLFIPLLLVLAILLPKLSNADPLDYWHSRNPSPTGNNLYGVTYASGTFVAVGDLGTILTSPDGVAWVPGFSGTSAAVEWVTYASGTFVAVGDLGAILTSPDGIAWTPRTSGTFSPLYGVTYGNGTFVAVGDLGTILTSSDGASWTPRTSGTFNLLTQVTYGNGTFVAVGWGATILTSPDGAAWTPRTSGTYYDLTGVTYGNGTFVAVGGVKDPLFGDYGTIFTSPDGVAWTLTFTFSQKILYGVNYVKRTFVAVGDQGALLTSLDGTAWTSRASGTLNLLWGVTYGGGTFVAVGDWGTILQSDPMALFVSPVSANFGNADVGTVSTPEVFTVTNPSEVDVVISSIELAGPDLGDFTLQSDFCTGQTLAALESCTTEISFSPKLFGLRTALLRVTSSDPLALELDVPLSGTGVQGNTVVDLFRPNGGESIPSSSPYEIQWGALPEATTFKLFYSLDNGTIWKRINTGAPLTGSSYLWQVPKTGGNKRKCLIKIIAYGSSGLRVGNDRSDGPFSIEVVKLTEPNGGGLPLKSGDPLTITWTTYATIKPVTKVLLSYTLEGGLTWKKIPTPPTFTGNPGSFDWTVPDVKKPKAKCKVKVVLKDAKGVRRGHDLSDNYFTISP